MLNKTAKIAKKRQEWNKAETILNGENTILFLSSKHNKKTEMERSGKQSQEYFKFFKPPILTE
jgi:hypothetical protein